jgi:hypothetical protein
MAGIGSSDGRPDSAFAIAEWQSRLVCCKHKGRTSGIMEIILLLPSESFRKSSEACQEGITSDKHHYGIYFQIETFSKLILMRERRSDGSDE